jgi:hypothetical protein
MSARGGGQEYGRHVVRFALPALVIALSLLDAVGAYADVVFDSTQRFPVSDGMGAVVASGDVNGDDKPDLVSVARYDPGAPVTVLLGQGDGTFKRLSTVAAGGLELATGDLNGDGDLDVAMPGWNSVATVLFGNGDGTFDAAVPVGGAYSGGAPGGIMSVAIAQLGGDDPGLDIAVTNANGLQVLAGKGDGTFAIPATYPGWDAAEMVVGDYTDDGHQDVALTRIIGMDTQWIAVLPGSATGALGDAIKTTIATGLGSPVATDDDGDGLLDLVGAERTMTGTTITLFYGTGDGGFEEPVSADLFGPPSRLGIGDFDADGLSDIAASTFENTLAVWLASGFLIESQYSLDVADGPVGMAIADMNGDGADDIATATFSPAKVIVSLNAPGVEASPASLAFGSLTVGSAAPARTVTLTNVGTPNLRIGGVALEGAAAGDYSAAGNCAGATLAAGATCTIPVGFTPRAAGARPATLVVRGNQADGPARIPLAGAGTAATVPPPVVVPDTTPPSITLDARRQRLAKVLRRGLKISVECSEACDLKAAAKLNARTARRLGLSQKRKPFTVARAHEDDLVAGQRATLRLMPRRSVARKLKGERALKLTLTVTALDAAGNEASTNRIVQVRR